jgi:uncharacterized DUF497 family protein
MRYEWDEQKNEANLAKHHIDFQDAPRIFLTPVLTDLDDRLDYDEDRWAGLGLLDGRVVKVVFTEPDEQTRRIISVRKALHHERKQYEQFLQDQLGAP